MPEIKAALAASLHCVVHLLQKVAASLWLCC